MAAGTKAGLSRAVWRARRSAASGLGSCSAAAVAKSAIGASGPAMQQRLHPIFGPHGQRRALFAQPGAARTNLLGAAAQRRSLVPVLARHRLAEQAAQAEERAILARGHIGEDPGRSRLVAGEPVRLRRQQQRLRGVAELAARAGGLALRQLPVAGGDRLERGGDRAVARLAAAAGGGAADPLRRGGEPGERPRDTADKRDQHQHGQHRHGRGGAHAVAADGHVH